MENLVRRPSCFEIAARSCATLKRGHLEHLYKKDVSSGSLVFGPPDDKPGSQSALRILQWNINGFSWSNRHGYALEEIGDFILKFRADVIVLQECSIKAGDFLRETLQEAGYRIALKKCSTLIATLLPIVGAVEVICVGRTTVFCQVQMLQHQTIAIYGAHLHHTDKDGEGSGVRLRQIQALLKHHAAKSSNNSTVIVADFNQQRCRDYAPFEWDVVARGMKERGEPEDDNVCSRLEAAGFICSLDAAGVVRNWPADEYPPPTHWTGTAIDYSFSTGLHLHGNYVVMTNLSDHLPVLTDWIVPVPESAGPGGSNLEPGVQIICPVCDGTGRLFDESCPLCDKQGDFLERIKK